MGGDYADIARALGGWAERVEDPAEVGPAIGRARAATEDGRAALLEFITSEELALSFPRPFGVTFGAVAGLSGNACLTSLA